MRIWGLPFSPAGLGSERPHLGDHWLPRGPVDLGAFDPPWVPGPQATGAAQVHLGLSAEGQGPQCLLLTCGQRTIYSVAKQPCSIQHGPLQSGLASSSPAMSPPGDRAFHTPALRLGFKLRYLMAFSGCGDICILLKHLTDPLISASMSPG